MTKPVIHGGSTMQEVLDAFPSARRALFTKYHIGGCSSCGYRPDESLASVAQNHGITDVAEVVAHIERSAEEERKLRLGAVETATLLRSGSQVRLLDLRSQPEFELARIEGAEPFTRQIHEQMAHWPRETTIVFVCHDGRRSMDAAAFFAGHGLTNVRYLDGGIDAWSQEVDASVPRYAIDYDEGGRHGVVRPLDASFRR